MILVRYVDLYDEFYDEAGNRCSQLLVRNATVPFDIKEDEIVTISPYFTLDGKLYRNVTLVEDRYGKSYKVVGNYKEIIKQKDNPKRTAVGYGTTNKI